ncbi:hypothetical protein LUZ62_044368 [Rhynchospora pubera]|uniref:KIB1-4 beta-propeller domain-containing protein n=1 Tax=Rhynchospora pubera TaxID=906938 RepID=A0AAV8FQA1_9POAL|nr:hypothetical protein LUZ62_044368 [Rhynchospora pubera]
MERGSSKPDWAGLLPELVALIGEKASSTIARYIHLRLVCKAWRRALIRPRNIPCQAPWLLLPRITEGEGSDQSDELIFYDPFQSKTHRIQSPYVNGKHICGSSHGWLVLEHDLKFSLFNPITQCTIHLPSFTVPATFFDYEVMGRCAHKAMLSGNPLEDGCLVVAWFSIFTNWELGFCRIGDTHWTGLLTGDNRQHLLDFACHKNLVYAVNEEKEVSVYDLHDLSARTFPSEIEYNGQNNLTFERIYLVHGDLESGKPLVVRRTAKCSITKEVFLYKWFDDRQQWCQVQNIGKRVFFLDNKHCINLQLEEDQEERRENELYYDVSRYLSDSTPTFFGGNFRVGINQVDLNTGIHVPLNHSPTGVFLFDAFQLPMWVTPSLI